MHKKNKGIVLVITLLIASILIIIALPYIARVATEYRLMSKMSNSTLALNLAEAGIERGIWEKIYNNSAFTGWTPLPNETWRILNVPFKNTGGNIIGYYDVTVSPFTGPTTELIVSTAYVPNKNKPDATKKITITYAGGPYHFTNAIVAASSDPSVIPSITMSGNVKTDSYDSSVGAYGSKLQTDTKRGNIQTNGPINLSGNAYVNGNANPGPDHPFNTNPPVSGSHATLSAPVTLSPVPSDTINAAKNSNSNGNITITHNGKTTPYTGVNVLNASGNDIITLLGGTYYFTSINVSGNAQVNVNGSSVIFVDGGDTLISGNGIVNSGTPLNLGIYSTGSNVTLSGNSSYVGTVYAPSATVSLSGNDNFYGAVVCGKSVDTGNASIHFDLSLVNNAVQIVTNNGITSWLEE